MSSTQEYPGRYAAPRLFYAGENDLTIWLVRDEVYCVPVFTAFFRQDRYEMDECFLRINNARWIIGGINDNAFCAWANKLL